MAARNLSTRSQGQRSSGRRVGLRFVILGAVLITAAAVFPIAGVALLQKSARGTYQIQMVTGTAPMTILMAQEIRAEAARHGVEVVLTTKEYGTLDGLAEVDSPSEIKFAMVNGGVTARSYPHVRIVTTLGNEYLHVLVKSDLAGKGIDGLRGKRTALGPATSASYHIARDVLNFADLPPTSGTKSGQQLLDQMTPEEGLRELIRIDSLDRPARAEAVAELPDAFMFLAPLPSPFARRLVTGFGYKLVPLSFGEAYTLDRLSPSNVEGVHVDRSDMTLGMIPAYTYRSNPPEPATGCPTICVPLILIAEDDADPVAVSLLLETIYESPLTSAIRPTPLNEQITAFPRHQGVNRYLRRNDPFLTQDSVARLGMLAGAMGAFLSGMFALYGFLRLRSLSRFEHYYREIGHIEMLARGLVADPAAPTHPESLRADLERRLTTLKCEVLHEFAESGLKGEGLMAGIIALINDTRDSLAGMDTARNKPSEHPSVEQVAH